MAAKVNRWAIDFNEGKKYFSYCNLNNTVIELGILVCIIILVVFRSSHRSREEQPPPPGFIKLPIQPEVSEQ